MTTTIQPATAALREVVGTFADRGAFESAVSALLAAGIERDRLSVLTSHDSLEVAGGKPQKWRDALVALVGEMKYEGPLVAAGLIALAAGPVGTVIASLVAAGVGGAALKELLDEVAAIPDSGDFARALAAGSVILWVSVETSEEEEAAKTLLAKTGGTDIHIFERAKGKRH